LACPLHKALFIFNFEVVALEIGGVFLDFCPLYAVFDLLSNVVHLTQFSESINCGFLGLACPIGWLRVKQIRLSVPLWMNLPFDFYMSLWLLLTLSTHPMLWLRIIFVLHLEGLVVVDAPVLALVDDCQFVEFFLSEDVVVFGQF